MRTRSFHEHVGPLLLRAHRLFAERALRKLCACGHARLGMAHVAILQHLEIHGTRASLLAERAGMTKQAASQLLASLEESGYVRRVADEADRRAMKILFTLAGRRFFADAQEAQREIEREFAAVLGAPGLEQLRDTLMKLMITAD
jgi:DNA-binding MarR family transcriptional regulator